MGTLQQTEDRLKHFVQVVRADVDKALPFVERAIDVAGEIYPIIGKVGKPLIQAIIKAEAANAAAVAKGETPINKLADVVSSLGPDIQAALEASGHAAQGVTVESTITKVVDGLRAPSVIPAK